MQCFQAPYKSVRHFTAPVNHTSSRSFLSSRCVRFSCVCFCVKFFSNSQFVGLSVGIEQCVMVFLLPLSTCASCSRNIQFVKFFIQFVDTCLR